MEHEECVAELTAQLEASSEEVVEITDYDGNRYYFANVKFEDGVIKVTIVAAM
jgi:hypothetical protein